MNDRDELVAELRKTAGVWMQRHPDHELFVRAADMIEATATPTTDDDAESLEQDPLARRCLSHLRPPTYSGGSWTLNPTALAAAIRAAGWVSPTAHAEQIRAARAEGLTELALSIAGLTPSARTAPESTPDTERPGS